MTVAELIEQLEELDPDTRVFVGFQPSYPLAGDVAAVTKELYDDGSDKAVWIAASATTYARCPYAPSEAWSGETFTTDENDNVVHEDEE